MEVADAGEGVLLDLGSVWTNQKSDSGHEPLFGLLSGRWKDPNRVCIKNTNHDL